MEGDYGTWSHTAEPYSCLQVCVFTNIKTFKFVQLFDSLDDTRVKPEGFPMENGDIFLANSNGVEDTEKVNYIVHF